MRPVHHFPLMAGTVPRGCLFVGAVREAPVFRGVRIGKKGGGRTLPASKARDSGGGREPGFPPTRLAAVAPPRCGALASFWESPLREPRENSRGGGVSAEGFRPAGGSRAGISAKFDKYEQIKTNSQLFPTLLRPFFDPFDRPLSHPVSPPFPHRRAHHPHQKYIPPGARPRTANAGWCAQMRARGGQMTGL